MVEYQTKRLIIDPGIFSELPDDLTDIWGVIITHEHRDHFDLANLRKLIERNPHLEIFTTGVVAAQLDQEGIDSIAVKGQQSIHQMGFNIDLLELDHAVIYGNSPCKNLTVGIGDFLYYPGDSLVSTPQPYKVLALPTSAPWYRFDLAINLARSISVQYVLSVHDVLLSQIGRDITYRLVESHLQETGKEFFYLDAGQSRQFD